MKKFFTVPLWLGIVLIAVIIFRIPSLFEPYFYGDEMIYLSLGDGINQGLVLYRDIHDNKPPLLYFLAALSGSLVWFRAILLVWMVITTFLFWKLSSKIFPKNGRIAQVATIFFAILTTLPLLEGNIANAELFMVGFTIIGFLFLLKEKLTYLDMILGGFAFSIAVLFKVPALFDLPVIFVYWILIMKWNKASVLDFIKKVFVIGIAFLVPIFLTFGWYTFRGAFTEYFIAAFAQNVGYLSSWRPDAVQQSFLEKNGPLLIRGFVVLIGLIILWITRKKLSKGFLLACVWLLFSLFAVTLSERPYPHYLIQAVPPVSLLIGILIASTRLEQVWTIIPLSLAIFVPVYFKFYYYDSINYYSRFSQFVTGQTNKWQYFNSFDQNTTRNYEIAKFLQESSTTNDRIFVWGDSSTIYAASHRLPPIKYVANYHINDFSSQEETIDKLNQNMPKFIVVLPNSPEFLALNTLLRENYLPIQNIDGADIWYLTHNEALNQIY